jgi:flagellar hook-basal body complex protein FliE
VSIGPVKGTPSIANLRALFEQQAKAASAAVTGAGTGPASAGPAASSSPAASGPSFRDSLVDAIRQANELQLQADEMSRALAAGQAAELHQVMLAAEKANLSLQFTLQVRNKVIEAYQEIMRVQV